MDETYIETDEKANKIANAMDFPTQQLTTYRRISQALTVLDVAKPITFTFEKTTTISDVLSEMGENIHGTGIILVKDKNRPYGFVTPSSNFKDSDQTAAIEIIAEKIDPRKVVSSNLSLYELIPLWTDSCYYLILNGATITHFVSRHHMDSAPVKTALFAMTAEFEGLILNLLMNDLTKVKERFERLPKSDDEKIKKFENMQKRAKGLTERKNLPDNAVAHIQSTFLSDKIAILLLDTDLCEFAFPGSDLKILKNNLLFITKFRNEIAHGGTLFNVLRDMSHLNEVIEMIETAIIDLRRTLTNGKQSS